MDATQEIVALGVCNIVSAFFRSIPVNGSFSRSAVSDASGVKTPGSGIYTGKYLERRNWLNVLFVRLAHYSNIILEEIRRATGSCKRINVFNVCKYIYYVDSVKIIGDSCSN